MRKFKHARRIGLDMYCTRYIYTLATYHCTSRFFGIRWVVYSKTVPQLDYPCANIQYVPIYPHYRSADYHQHTRQQKGATASIVGYQLL